MTRVLTANNILPNKSQPFSIVWEDNTDSICDLQCLLTYMDNYANKRHKADATRSSTTNGSARRASNGAAAPSSIPSSSSLPQPPLPPHNVPADTPASATGIFADIPSRPGDLVDNLIRSGSFSFLCDLLDTKRLFELRDFRIPRVMTKGEAIEQFAASMHLVLDLADKYPRGSLTLHIPDSVAQFLPALLCPDTRRGRVKHIISNTKCFQRGDWKYLWETALRLARRETDYNVEHKHKRAKRDTLSIKARVVYAEHCTWRGALSKTNQSVTSNTSPNADPNNINLLRAKHPDPAHPVRISSIL
jgi:hypothetical protein